jgi:hypothetical protein
MNFKRFLALALALALMLALFTGCGSTDLADFVGDYVTPAADTSSDSSDTTTTTFDYDAAYAYYDPDTVMLTVNGKDVTWGTYFYWLYSNVSNIAAYYGTDFDWDDEYYDGVSYKETVYSGTMDYVKLYTGIEAGAAELNVTIDEETDEDMISALESDVEYYGSGDEDTFWEYMATMYITKDTYTYMNKVSVLYQRAFTAMYGETGENCPEADVLEAAEDDGYMQAKHILLKTVDDDSESLSEEEIDEKYSQAQEILAMLDASDDPVALFDELMDTYNEDTGEADFPNGYLFTSSDMVEEFSNAAAELGEYEYSGIVESSYGYHIIMRLPIDVDTAPTAYASYYGTEYGLRYYVAWELYDSVVNGWEDNLEIIYSEAYENMDLSQIFHV